MNDTLCIGGKFGRVNIRVDTNEDRSQSDEGVKRCYQFRHTSHFDSPCNDCPDYRANDEHGNEQRAQGDTGSEDRCEDCDCHADDAEPDGTFGFLLIGQTAKRQDEQHS